MSERTNCTRCESYRVLRLPTTPAEHSHIALGERLLHTVSVDKYVCTDCGCVEERVSDAPDLARLRTEYTRVAMERREG